MDALEAELERIAKLDVAKFAARFQPNEVGRVNGKSTADCPRDCLMLRQPASSEKDIRVTIPHWFMQEWKPAEWKEATLKNKKIQLLVDGEEPGLFIARPVPPDTIGKGVYRLEQNDEKKQARFMTTRSYVSRQMNEKVEFVPFRIHDSLGVIDLRGLNPLSE